MSEFKEWRDKVLAAATEAEMEKALAEGPPRSSAPGWGTVERTEAHEENAAHALLLAGASAQAARLKFLPTTAIMNHLIASRHTCFREAFHMHACDAVNGSGKGGDSRKCDEAGKALASCMTPVHTKLQQECPRQFQKLHACLERRGTVDVLECQADLLAFDRCTEDFTP